MNALAEKEAHLAERIPLAKDYCDEVAARLKLPRGTEPTSGMISVELCVDLLAAGVVEEVSIVGFDFFEGEQRHYFQKYEPFFERVVGPWWENVMFTLLNWQGHRVDLERERIRQFCADGKLTFLK